MSGRLYPTALPVGQPIYELPVVPQPAFEPQPPRQPPDGAHETLVGRGWPRGLIKQVVDSAAAFPIRLLVVDNSGSMQMADGSRLVSSGRECRMVDCTRWQELCETLASVATLAAALNARTDFLLLNPPGGGAPQCASVGGVDSALPVPRLGPTLDDSALRTMMNAVQPSGSTPLTEAVLQVISLLEPVAAELHARGQQAVVVLATDGLPNDKPSFLQALRSLQTLPVWLVVRLCTNDDQVVSYWNELDASLERDLEVLDDEAGEAEEIIALNPWLTYGPPLHVARTFGLKNRLFDLLDETKLHASQVREFCEILLGCGTLPEPQLDFPDFFAALSAAVHAAPSTVDPKLGRIAPWIRLQRVRRMNPNGVCPGLGSCALL